MKGRRMAGRVALSLILFCGASQASTPWTVTGAGNVTCREWAASDHTAQSEVLAWMTGFASAINITYASKGWAQLPLQRLTDDYLRREITDTCSQDANSNVSMVVIIFKTIKDLPFKET